MSSKVVRAGRRIGALTLILAAVLFVPAHAAEQAPEIEIRVQLSPIRQAVLSSGMAGRITELAVREGDRFAEGDRLVGFDCSVYQAQLNRANAAESGARKKLEVAERLEKLNSISLTDVAQAQSAQGVARAEIGVTQAMLRNCTLSAPFSGRVSARKVQRWEYVPEGKELLSIYDDSAYELELIVPSRWLAWVKPNLTFTVRLDETGGDYPARITRTGSVIDPLNQSVKVFGQLTGSTVGLLPGMSGAAHLEPPVK